MLTSDDDTPLDPIPMPSSDFHYWRVGDEVLIECRDGSGRFFLSGGYSALQARIFELRESAIQALGGDDEWEAAKGLIDIHLEELVMTQGIPDGHCAVFSTSGVDWAPLPDALSAGTPRAR